MGIFSSLFKQTCFICKRKMSQMTVYKNDKGDKVKVCLHCREYAERRAFRKI